MSGKTKWHPNLLRRTSSAPESRGSITSESDRFRTMGPGNNLDIEATLVADDRWLLWSNEEHDKALPDCSGCPLGIGLGRTFIFSVAEREMEFPYCSAGRGNCMGMSVFPSRTERDLKWLGSKRRKEPIEQPGRSLHLFSNGEIQSILPTLRNWAKTDGACPHGFLNGHVS